MNPARIALVGDRSALVQAHGKIPSLIEVLGRTAGSRIEPYWLHSSNVDSPEALAGFDGIWVVPGSPYANAEGILAAVEAARTTETPFLGTCGGFQYMLIEFARNVCGLKRVHHAESHPDADDLLIVALECSLLGEEATVTVKASTRAAGLMGAGPSVERFFCRYGLSSVYSDVLERHGMIFSGVDDAGAVRVAELTDHPFFIGSLFQPELSSDASWVHPLIAGFVTAACRHAARQAMDLPA